jgi:DNA-directed RNA polymerase specialized sigma24 family protein
MQLKFKHYTPKQYAAILLHDDFKMTLRQIAERLDMSESGVRYILKHIKKTWKQKI